EGREQDVPRVVAGHREGRAGGVETVEARHPDVHEDDVGVGAADEVDDGRSVLGAADDVHVRLRVEQSPEALPDHGLIIDDGHTDRRRRRWRHPRRGGPVIHVPRFPDSRHGSTLPEGPAQHPGESREYVLRAPRLSGFHPRVGSRTRTKHPFVSCAGTDVLLSVSAMIITAIVLATAAALCLALGTHLQRHAVAALPPGLRRRSTWVAGLGLMGLVTVLNVIALGLGPVSIVQPIGAVSLVFAALISRSFFALRLGAPMLA